MAPSIESTVAAMALSALRHVEPELAHQLALRGLRLLGPIWRRPRVSTDLGVNALGLRFAHPVGVAAGFDKDGDFLDAIGCLGFSHVEVGTVTPDPQEGNPRPRLFRIPDTDAVINRMGFNSKGVGYVARRLLRTRFGGVLGVSIGKNAATPIEQAHQDYLRCFRGLYPLASYIAVNVSSPNTENLRDLQSAAWLSRIVVPLQEERVRLSRSHGKTVPLLIKIAPDLADDELASLAAELRRLGVDGVIATNTTTNLDGVRGVLPAHRGGGLSGEPLHARSVAVIARLRSELGRGFPIIGVGGITTAAAALATLDAGASLIQLYTGLIYRGPALLTDILDALAARRPKERSWARAEAKH
jgi:dihydroorotate dehydrogenase